MLSVLKLYFVSENNRLPLSVAHFRCISVSPVFLRAQRRLKMSEGIRTAVKQALNSFYGYAHRNQLKVRFWANSFPHIHAVWGSKYALHRPHLMSIAVLTILQIPGYKAKLCRAFQTEWRESWVGIFVVPLRI